MYEYDCLTLVELFKNWKVRRIAQPFVAVAGQDANAVRLKYVECVLDLTQSTIYVGKWHDREQSEASRMAPREFGSVFVTLTGGAARPLLVTEPDARG